MGKCNAKQSIVEISILQVDHRYIIYGWINIIASLIVTVADVLRYHDDCSRMHAR